MTAKILCCGIAVLDLIYTVDHLPSDDGKISARAHYESGGGMAANAAVAIARLGGRASWCGRLGDDDRGRAILEKFDADQVDAQLATIMPGVASPHSIVLIDPHGRRALVLYRPPMDGEDVSWVPIEAIGRADAVLADNRWVAGARTALVAARSRGIPAVLDADVGTGAETIAAVRAATHTIFSAAAIAELYGVGDPETALRRAALDCPFVGVTLGEKGVGWIDATGAFRALPAFSVAAIETVGAGDVFHGAFTLALLETGDEARAMRFAAAAAALKCAGEGGRASFPYRASVEALLAAHPDPAAGTTAARRANDEVT